MELHATINVGINLCKFRNIDLLQNGYSTISLGYAGLYECVKFMTGNSHTDGGKGHDFAIEVMKKLNDKCKEWKEMEKIDYSVYGTPIESTTYKFAKCLKERFGKIKGITDRDYITNSYHVPVFEKIDPFTKLSIESKFQKLSPGGAISYIECADLTHNTEAVLNKSSDILETCSVVRPIIPTVLSDISSFGKNFGTSLSLVNSFTEKLSI